LIAELAYAQEGVVGRAQLRSLGVSDKAIRIRLATKRLHRIHAGVYSIVPPSMLSRNGRYIAATFAGGEAALVSFRAAGALHVVRSTPTGPIDITINGRGSRRIPGLRVHSTRRLHPDDVDDIDGVPCTSLARTFIDLAEIESDRALTKMVEKALILQTYDQIAVDAALERSAGRAGPARLRRVIALIGDPPNTSNDFERDFLFLVDEESLGHPIVNGWVLGYQVDFHWPDAKLIVETDGRAAHATPIAFERDRERDLAMELAGWHVLRISHRQLRAQPTRIAALVRAKLRERTRASRR
jgi:very-short-patch-repair endonuclease